MAWVNPNEPFPGEPTRHALSGRLHAHAVHHDREEEEEGEEEEEEERDEERDEEEEARARGRAPLTSAELDRFRMIMEQERQQMVEEVATNNGPLGMRSEPQPDIDRAQDLEMVATHASVEGLRLPPDLIALAYDRNDGDIVNAIMNLTEPIFRRQLERELAERQAEAAEGQRRYHSMHHPAHWDSAVGGLSDRSYAHQVHHAEEEEEEPPDARELDLWLLESQVPGCTRERAERAYNQGQEDVTRALPLARMATLLADRDGMVDFLMEMQPGGLRVHAENSYDHTEGDIVDAVVEYHQRSARSRNEEPMRDRCLHRLRIRTVFALALIYRERYGQMHPEASAAIAQSPLAARPRTPNLPSFLTPDGVRWTYSAEQGWERRLEMEPAHVGRAAQATEQLARLADARGQPQTAARARQTAAYMRNAQSAVAYRGVTPQQAIEARRSREATRNDAAPLPSSTAIIQRYIRHNTALTYRRALEYAVPSDDGWRAVSYARSHAAPPELSENAALNYAAIVAERQRAVEREREQEASETSDVESDDDESQFIPTELAEGSGSSEDDENEAPTAGTYAQPRAFVRLGLSRRESVAGLASAIKGRLRAVQEHLDTEMANSNDGVVLSEGAYLGMMEAIKHIWESAEKLSR